MSRISLSDQCIKALADVLGPDHWPNTGGICAGIEAMIRTARRQRWMQMSNDELAAKMLEAFRRAALAGTTTPGGVG